MPNPPREPAEQAAMPLDKSSEPAPSGDRHDAGIPEKKQGELGQGGSAQRTKE